MAEVAEAVDAVFHDLDDLPRLVLRRYRKGLNSDAAISGVQGRRQIGSPISVEGVVTQSHGRGARGRPSYVYIRASATGSATIENGSPEDSWTIQEPGGQEVEITGTFKRLGPAAGESSLWRATLSAETEVPSGP